jgi:cytochrome c peroxidase
LRNIALTAPYGHNGAYPTLEGIVRHHLDPAGMRAAWTKNLAALPSVPWLEAIDFVIQFDRFEMARQAEKLDIKPVQLSQGEIADIVAFLHSLTGERAKKGRLGRPDSVPSGLSVD